MSTRQVSKYQIALCGRQSSQKSSIRNALLAEDCKPYLSIRDVSAIAQRGVKRELTAARLRTAELSDLALLVAVKDVNVLEHEALKKLQRLGKPTIVVIIVRDAEAASGPEVLALRSRLHPLVGSDNPIVLTEAPRGEAPGKGRRSARRIVKDVEPLVARIVGIASEQHKRPFLPPRWVGEEGRETLRIALYGRVNAGKSSIINALLGREAAKTSARAGETRKSAEFPLTGDEYTLHTPELGLSVIDSPGIAEAGGGKRAEAARRVVKQSDLVLFVLPGDITETEFRALSAVRDLGKPAIVALTKTDTMASAELKQTLDSLHRRLDDLLGEENLLTIAAAPLRRVLVVDPETGEEREDERAGEPDVEVLKQRIVAIANAEGKALKQLSSYLVEYEKAQDQQSKRLAKANEKVFDFAVVTALGVAANPLPAVDVLGGIISAGALDVSLAKLYGAPLGEKENRELTDRVWQECRSQLAGVLALIVGGSLLKTLPGLGTGAGAVMQAGAAGYFVYVMGQCTIAYLENGRSWKEGDLKATLAAIIASTDRRSVTARIVEHVKTRFAAS